MTHTTTALALFSGGLDSMLACRVVAEQGVRVKAIKFVTPFFDYDLLANEEQYREKIYRKYKIDVVVKDLSEAYLALLKNPPHGYGKHFNPCIDCKILMISEAKKLMPEYNASFLITGEVIGQRPMSQRKDTLRIIERDSLTDSILLRPLCAKSQKPTEPELSGVIDREKLPNFSGRGRTQQMELAEKFGITDYPSPAGGCVLTDPILANRIEHLFHDGTHITIDNIRFLLVGRQFRLPNGGWLVMGRRKQENDEVLCLKRPGDILLRLQNRPGPTALLRHSHHEADIQLGAALVARYGKKIKESSEMISVKIISDNEEYKLQVAAATDQELDSCLYQTR